jgi:hypothetical protein
MDPRQVVRIAARLADRPARSADGPARLANLKWNKTSTTISATSFVGSGPGLTALNASNVSLGTLSIYIGGTGVASLTVIKIGNTATSILQSANSTLKNTSNHHDTLTATNLIRSGSGITNLNITI